MKNEIVNLGVTDAAISELRAKYSDVPDASTKEGYGLVKEAKNTLTKYVTGVEKERKIQVRDAVDHQKNVNSEAKRVTAELEMIRQPMILEKKRIDDEKERLKQEKLNAEINRINTIESKIAEI